MSRKAWIHSIATAVPPHEVTERTVTSYADRWLGGDAGLTAAVIDLMKAIKVDSRRFAFTPEELLANRGLEWMNREYAARILPLAEDATRRALDAAGMTPSDVDLIVTTSCTGFTIPALDAFLANRLSMRPDLKRLPITELGCAAGAAALSHAGDYLKAWPDRTVLVLTA
jgi:predicted naringenin-chalcone synthase